MSGRPNGAAAAATAAGSTAASATAAAGPRRGAIEMRWRCRMRSLWPLWYAASALGLQAFLVYQGCQRYSTYRSLPWRHAAAAAARTSLDAYVALLAVSCCCLLAGAVGLFLTTAIDSYAAAGLKLGRDRLKRELTAQQAARAAGQLVRRGLPPAGPALHVAASFCLLLAPVFSEAEAVKGQMLSVDNVAEFDMLETKLLNFNVSQGGNDVTASSASVPGLLPELANFAYAISTYSVAYASTFWFTSRHFSVIFLAQLLGAAVLHCLSFSGWRLLLLCMSSNSAGVAFILTPAWLTSLYLIGNAVLFLSSSAVFHHGYGQCRDKIFSTLKKFYRFAHSTQKGGFMVYAPHTAALVAIVIVVACLGPILYDHVSAYKKNGSQLLLAHLLCSVIYMLLWIMLWFSFTIKQSWNFKVQEAVVKRHAVMLNRHRVFGRSEDRCSNEQDDSPSSGSSVPPPDAVVTSSSDMQQCGSSIRSADSLSSTSTTNDGSDSSYRKAPNGILSQKIKQKRRLADQKVKFQDATKVVIETNLDSDLDTIPESTNEDSSSYGHRRDSPLAGATAPYLALDAPDSFAGRANGRLPSPSLEANDEFAILRLNGIAAAAAAAGYYMPPSDELIVRAASLQREPKSSGEPRSGRDSAIFSINSSQENSDCEVPSRPPPNLLRLNSAV